MTRSYQDLGWETDDGLRFAPLYRHTDVQDLVHLRAARTILQRSRPPAIRQWIDACTPRQAAGHVAAALAGGAEEILLQFDNLARHGTDPGTLTDADAVRDLFTFDAGSGGCAIYHLDALHQVLEPVDLRRTRIALAAGAASLPVLGMLFAVADRRDIPRHALQVDVGIDPLGELAAGRPRAATLPALCGDIARGAALCQDLPGVVPIAVCSDPYHAAGAAPAEELACAIATGISYLRQLIAGDGAAVAPRAVDQACRLVNFRFPVDTEIYLEIAKLRAARLLWAKVTRAFGATDHSTAIHVTSSPRSLSGDDVHTNLLRTGIQAFAATLAGADSIALATFDQTHDARDAQAQALARNQLLLLRDEAHLQRVQDPTAGAYAVEALTDRIARAAWTQVQEIEAAGGMVQALCSGLVQQRLQSTGLTRRDRYRTRRRALVGATRFVDPRFLVFDTHTPDLAPIHQDHQRHLQRRDSAARDAALAQRPIDLAHAATAGVTVGELATLLRGDHPLDDVTPLLAFASDGAEFEQLRQLVRVAGLRVLPVLAGPTSWSRAREGLARDYFVAGGFEVLPALELSASVDIEGHQPHIVVLCSDDAGYRDLLPQAQGDYLRIVAGEPQDELRSRVDGFIHAGDNTYLQLRHLYLGLTAAGDDAPHEGSVA